MANALGTIIAGLLVMAVILLIGIPFAILNGWVLSWLWLWFVVPVFAVPALSMLQSIGIATVISFMTKQYVPTGDKAGEAWAYLILTPLVTLLFGYIIHSFM